jgi:hypothetical protein
MSSRLKGDIDSVAFHATTLHAIFCLVFHAITIHMNLYLLLNTPKALIETDLRDSIIIFINKLYSLFKNAKNITFVVEQQTDIIITNKP